MKALAVYPGKPNSMHLEEVPRPTVDDVADGRGVLVQVLRVGVDGTDKEINEARYGRAPEGSDFLITGHENLGVVLERGPSVPSIIQPGSLVVSTVRRPGTSIYDEIGMQDVTTDDVYYERGINLLHGYLTEAYVEDAQYVVRLPDSLHEVGVLLEPLTVSEKGVRQASEIQRRLKVWRPQRACVLGSGTIGLLASLVLRLRGLEVVCYSKPRRPCRNCDLINALGATYVSSDEISLADAAKRYGPFDVMFECTGFSPLVFEAAEVLGKNGVLILSSITGGNRTAEVRTDAINQGFVLGNKVIVGTVNAGRDDFVQGVDDMLKAEALYPGWLEQLLTTPINGLENYQDMLQHLTSDPDAIKVFMQVSSQLAPAG
jgi:threonine dehydrogenase-like Zn-dependent dehydrogenase